MAELPPVTMSTRSMRSFGIELMSGETALFRMSAATWRRPLTRTRVRLRAEAAKIEQVEAGDADAEARILLREGAAKLRQLVQSLADVGVALLEELLAADRGDRNGRFEVRTADARTGDGDLLLFARVGDVAFALSASLSVDAGLKLGLTLQGGRIGLGFRRVLREGRRGEGHGKADKGSRANRARAEKPSFSHPEFSP